MMVGSPLGPSDQATLPRVADYTAMIGLAGDLCGVLSFRCSHASAARIAGKMLGTEESTSAECIRDALGEICNMVAGSFKGQVSDVAAQCMLSVPTVVSGKDYEMYPLADGMRIQVAKTFEGALDLDDARPPRELTETASSLDFRFWIFDRRNPASVILLVTRHRFSACCSLLPLPYALRFRLSLVTCHCSCDWRCARSAIWFISSPGTADSRSGEVCHAGSWSSSVSPGEVAGVRLLTGYALCRPRRRLRNLELRTPASGFCRSSLATSHYPLGTVLK